MRGDLQVDKGNGIWWGFGREEPGPRAENASVDGAFAVANSKTSEKMQRAHAPMAGSCSVML